MTLLCPRPEAVVGDSGRTDSVGKASSAAGAFAVEAFGQCGKSGRLPNCHDRLERQRSTMGIVTVGDASHGMAKGASNAMGTPKVTQAKHQQKTADTSGRYVYTGVRMAVFGLAACA